MNKFQLKDIVIKSPGVQVREKIIEKYGTIKDFADAIDLYESSINQYLSSKNLGSSTFKIRTISALGVDFNEIFESDTQQVRNLTSQVSWYIQNYNLKKDILVFEKLKKLCLERELMEDYAIVCRCYAHYFMNIGKKDRAYAYIEVAVNTMRDREYKDRFALYLSDLIKMKATDLNRGSFKKLIDEIMSVISLVKGPITTGGIYSNLGDAYFAIGEYEKSEECYKKIFEFVEDEKGRSFAYIGLGNVQKALGNFDKAFDYYNDAQSLIDPRDSDIFFIYDELSGYYYDKGILTDAEKYIDKVFLDEKYEVSSTNNTRLETYFKVKLALEKENEIVLMTKKLLGEIKLDYIYTINHLQKLDEILEQNITSANINEALSKLISKYYLNNDLSEEYKRVLKQILGSILLKGKN